MRDIKFRGKSYERPNNDWVYGSVGYPNTEHPYIRTEHHYCYPVDFKTLGQYTGLKDKSGKEIYEGDLLETEGWNPTEGKWKKIFEVVFSDAMFCLRKNDNEYGFFGEREGKDQLQKGIVVGNIHENPELLDGQK